MSNGFCEVCGKPRVYVNPGTNKKGKDYSASMRCPDRDCKGKPVWLNEGTPAPVTNGADKGTPPQQETAKPTQRQWVPPDPDIEAMKQRAMCASSAFKSACEGLSPLLTGPPQQSLQTYADAVMALAVRGYNNLMLQAIHGRGPLPYHNQTPDQMRASQGGVWSGHPNAPGAPDPIDDPTHRDYVPEFLR